MGPPRAQRPSEPSPQPHLFRPWAPKPLQWSTPYHHRPFLTLPPPPQGQLNVAGHPCVAYDPTGFVFAVLLNLRSRSTLLLYDLKNFDKQPFVSIALEDPVLGTRSYPPRIPICTSLAFSNDGKWLLVGTSGDTHYVADAFEGTIVARLESEFHLFRPSFFPDSSWRRLV